MTETTTIPSRIAELADDSQLVHGIAISAGEVTRGLNGRKKWPADALRASAASLKDTPVNALHSEQTVGTVRRAAYDESRDAILYELELTDAKLAEQVRSGDLEVSIEARHGSDGETDDGAMLVSSITFSGIALVQHGASATASAEHGPAPEQAFAAALSAGQIQSALAEHDAAAQMDVPEEYVFDNPGEAVEAAADLGWTDGPGDERIHSHGEGEDTVFMPGPSHDDLRDALEERGELAATQADEPTAELLDADAPYEVTNVSPGDVGDDEWTDAEWDGSAAIAAAPNPSEDADAPAVLDAMMALNPADDEARDAKSSWGGPFRAEPGGPVNTRALVAIDGALDGARNGFAGLSDGVRENTSEWVQSMLEAAPDGLFGSVEAAEAAEHMAADALMKSPEQGDIVVWNSQGERPAAGRVIETIDEGRYDTELSGDAVVNAPAALIRLYRPTGDGEWGKTDVTVAHRTDTETLAVVDEWPERTRAEMAAAEDVSQLDEAAESAMGARGGSTPQPDSQDSMSDNDPNDPDAPDEPSVEELRARLSENHDRIDELEAELSTVKAERDEFEQKAEAVDEAEAAFAAALADHVPRDAEALQADLSLTQMREWVADIENASVGDAALSDTDPEPAVQSGGGEETAQLSGAALEEKQELESQIEQQEARLASAKDDSMAERLAAREKERLENRLDELEA
jgi:hypothetical protein